MSPSLGRSSCFPFWQFYNWIELKLKLKWWIHFQGPQSCGAVFSIFFSQFSMTISFWKSQPQKNGIKWTMVRRRRNLQRPTWSLTNRSLSANSAIKKTSPVWPQLNCKNSVVHITATDALAKIIDIFFGHKRNLHSRVIRNSSSADGIKFHCNNYWIFYWKSNKFDSIHISTSSVMEDDAKNTFELNCNLSHVQMSSAIEAPSAPFQTIEKTMRDLIACSFGIFLHFAMSRSLLYNMLYKIATT